MVMSPKDRERLSALEIFIARVRRAHALVEQFASSPKEADQLGSVLRRTFSQMRTHCTTSGFDRLSQLCGGLEMTSRRGMSHVPKARALRDGMGNLTRQIDLERRQIMTAAQKEDAPPE